MSVWKNCYLFRTGEQKSKVTIEYRKSDNPDIAFRVFEGNELSYTHDGKGNLIKVRDPEGNYYYLAEDCQKIQE